jgi:hypothetical protein
LKREEGPVSERLRASEADHAVMDVWKNLVSQELLPEDDEDGF